MIKLFQLDRLWQEIRQDALADIDAVASQGYAQRGPSVENLEKWLRDYSGRRNAITVASCTDALRCSLQFLFKDYNNSFIAVPSYTFAATVHAIKNAGCTPVFIDVDEDYHMRVDTIPAWINGIVTVDLFGLAQNYDGLRNLGVPVIMDAAQSIETFDEQGRSSLNQGWASCTSFAPTKTIPAFGSGGAILTDDDDFAEWARRWRTHGKITNSDMSVCYGANSMMSSLEAAQVLCGVQRHLAWRQRREDIANIYTASINSRLITAPNTRGVHTWHKYVIRCQDQGVRVRFQNYMKERGIDTQLFYNPLVHQEHIYANDADVFHEPAICDFKLVNSEWLSNRSVGIPCQHTLTDQEVNIISTALREYK